MLIELEEVSGQLDWLQALAVSMVADQQAAEDLVQRALQEATAKKDWRPGRLKSWLAGTVHNMAHQYFRTESRRRKREQRVVALAELRAKGVRDAAVGALPEELAEQVESQNLLTAAVLDLRDPYRETLLLFYYGNQSQKEIANTQGISPRTVETRLRRARQSLRKHLENQFGKESWAFGLLPLLRRNPPPSLPPPLTSAGPGSWGEGWWATVGVILAVSGWSWLGSVTDQFPLAPITGDSEVVVAGGLQTTPDIARTKVAVTDDPELGVASSDGDFQEFVLQERGTGIGLEGLRLRLLFLRPANAVQRLQPEAQQFFQPKDRIWWKLGEAVALSHADGHLGFTLPQAATHVMVDLNVHSPTHSLSGYSVRFKALPRAKIAGRLIPLEMVRRTGVASGYVLDQNNNPLAEVLVDVFFDAPRKLSVDPVFTMTTAANGSFRIPNIACDQGGFRLRPRGTDYASIRSLRMQRYAGFGADYPGISLVLAPGRQIARVMVKDEAGQPVAGVVVKAALQGRTEKDLSYEYGTYLQDWSASAITNEDGLATLHQLPVGEILWSARHPSFLVTSQVELLGSTDLVFTMRRGHTEHFVVQSASGPVEGAVVGVYSKTMRRTSMTDAEGRATFLGLPTDESMHFTVSHPHFVLWMESSNNLLSGAHVTSVSLQKGVPISGRVEWDAQAPGLEGERPRVFVRPLSAAPLTEFPMRVSHRPDSGWWQVVGLDETTVAADGSFSFYGLPDAEVELWFGLRRRPLGFAQAHTGDSDVLLTLGSGMMDRATVDIHVFDELSGRPITTHYLFWTNLDADQPVTLPAIIVHAADGRYRHLGLKPGLWTLTAWAPQGFTTRRLAAQPIGPGLHALEIPLSAARGLRLRVLDERGQVLQGVEISALAEDGGVLLQGGLLGGGFRAWSRTNAQGQVAMSHLPATQPYRLVCKYQGQDYSFDMPGAQAEAALHELVLVVAQGG